MIVVDGFHIPETLEEMLIPSRTAHIIIDLQNDFCQAQGALAHAGGDVSFYPQVINKVAWFIEKTRNLGILQIFVKYISLPRGLSDSPAWIWLRRKILKQYDKTTTVNLGLSPFCLKDTWGARLVDDLNVIDETDLVVKKFRSSAFFGTNLDIILQSKSIESLIFSGCTTEGCVESTVRDAGFRNYFSLVVEDLVASDVLALHEASLKVMGSYRAELVTSAQVLGAINNNYGI